MDKMHKGIIYFNHPYRREDSVANITRSAESHSHELKQIS